MSLKLTHENLLKLKRTASTNDKISLLSEMLQNEEFRTVIVKMYDSLKHYKVQKLSPFKSQGGMLIDKPSNTELFNCLDRLADQKGTSNADKAELSRLASMDRETYEVVKMIINKDAKVGISVKSINKAWDGLVFDMPYCRCSTAKKMDEIRYEEGAIAQEKADGAFNNIFARIKGTEFRTRNGKLINQLIHLYEMFMDMNSSFKKTVYMGELLIMRNGIILPRQTGNGIINSCIQNTADQSDADRVILKLWDAVPEEDFWRGFCDIWYSRRLTRTVKAIKHIGDSRVSLIETKKLYSLADAELFYRRMRHEGKEGAIIKNPWAIWKYHTSTDMVKMKNISEAELRVVSWKSGKKGTQYEHCMGSVQLESDDGKVQVSVSGFTEEEHNMDWDEMIGKIGSLQFDSLIEDKSRKGIYSLYLPRNLEMRFERNDTDTLEDLMER